MSNFVKNILIEQEHNHSTCIYPSFNSTNLKIKNISQATSKDAGQVYYR